MVIPFAIGGGDIVTNGVDFARDVRVNTDSVPIRLGRSHYSTHLIPLSITSIRLRECDRFRLAQRLPFYPCGRRQDGTLLRFYIITYSQFLFRRGG